MTKLDISLSFLLWDKDLCTDLVQSQQREEKWNEKWPPLSSLHIVLCGNRRGPRNPCAITAGLLITWPCAQSHLVAPLPQEGATQPSSARQRRKGFHNSCVSLSAQGNANGPARARPCLGSHGWQQCSKSGSDWERIGFLYPLSVKLRLQHRKNHLFTGAKAAECSSKHLAPDHSSREPSFPNHSYSFRERMMILKEFSHRPWGHKVAMSIFLLWGRGFLQNLLTWRSDLALGGLIPGSQFRCKTGTY